MGKMNILVICDDKWHPAEVIQKGLASLPAEKYQFDFVVAAKDILTTELIHRYPVIISCKSNNITAGNDAPWFEDGVTEVGGKELQEYVEQGGNFIAVHSANAFFEYDSPAYRNFVGNTFVTHPPRCEVGIHVTELHPVTQGVEDFTIRDEHYQVTISAPDAQVLFTTSSKNGGTQPGGYVRHMGNGKLCVLTPGHMLSVWQHPMFQRLLINTIEWMTGAQ